MKAVSCAVALFCLGLPSTLYGVGFAHDETFIVYAPDQALADQVIAKAREFRKAEAKDLLGMELEPRAGRTIISVEVSATKDSGFTGPSITRTASSTACGLRRRASGRRPHSAS